MKLIIKGFIIGLGKIMPGVSGAMIAITLKEYDKIIESIANIKKDIYNNIKYLSKIGLGIILAIIIMSKIIVNSLNQHYFSTMLLFIGIIISGIIEMTKNITINKKDIIISIVAVIILCLILTILKKQNSNNNTTYNIIEFIKLINMGIIDAISSIVPGISGTALLMYFGYYNKIINTFATISNITLIKNNILILTPFIIGFILGTITISKIINNLIKKYPNIINITITIFMIYTTTKLSLNTFKRISSIEELLLGILLFIATLIISIKISNKKKKNIYI